MIPETDKRKIASLRQFKQMFDQLPDGVITITATKPHTVLKINAAACNLLQVERRDVLEKKTTTVFKQKFSVLLQLIDEAVDRQRAIKNFALEINQRKSECKTILVSVGISNGKEPDNPVITLVLHDISETTQLRKHTRTGDQFEALIGNTPKMKAMFSLIDRIASYDTAVLIYGETGTGKELVAKAIHERSSRSNAPFIPVHCSALASNLLESDLFGHVKGAFTGAVRDRLGRFELAEGGTVFLDEIATLSPETQVKLLRVLQEKTIERVGDIRTKTVDVRIISATNRSLPELISNGKFRQDLYYRIKVVQLELPSLRARSEDIPVLAEYFVDKFNRKHNQKILNISRAAHDLLSSYSWPGNVRELENAIEHAVVLCQAATIEPRCLPPEIHSIDRSSVTPASDDGNVQESIRRSLKATGGNVTRAAGLLGIHRTTLWRKMKELGISRPS